MKRLVILFVLVTIAAVTTIRDASAQATHLRISSTEGEFEEVKLFVQDAIVGQGLTINYNGNIGLMLGRTRAAVGNPKMIYKSAEFFLFCSATISRATMAADPTNISFCPYIIYFYELAGEAGKVYVGYRRPEIVGSEASKKALVAVDGLLNKIIKEATE